MLMLHRSELFPITTKSYCRTSLPGTSRSKQNVQMKLLEGYDHVSITLISCFKCLLSCSYRYTVYNNTIHTAWCIRDLVCYLNCYDTVCEKLLGEKSSRHNVLVSTIYRSLHLVSISVSSFSFLFCFAYGIPSVPFRRAGFSE